VSLTYGPKAQQVRPQSESDVTVTYWDGRPAPLAVPIGLDANGGVSFAVTTPGRYLVVVDRGRNRSVDTVDLVPDSLPLAQQLAQDPAFTSTYAQRGQASQAVVASLPNLTAAVTGNNDASPATLRIVGFGSSVGVGATLPNPATQAPVARFAARLQQTVNLLGNLNLATTNASVNGSSAIDFTGGTYAAAQAGAGGTPTVALFCYGMNDGMTGAYHQGQTFPGFVDSLRAAVTAVLGDGGDAVIATTPHPRTSMAASWSGAVDPVVYPPGGVAVPAFTPQASVVTADWLGTGTPVAASYRHLRINQAMREVAAELGVVLLDVERYWVAAVAEHGEDALFDTNEYAHPNLLGHQLSYWLAIDDLMRTLSNATVGTAVPRPRTEMFVVKNSNEARTNTTTLANDPQLHFPVGVGSYLLDLGVFYTGDADLRVGFNLPAGSSGSMAGLAAGTQASNYNGDVATARRVNIGDTYGLPLGGNGADAHARVTGVLHVSTPGTVTVQWCQDTSSAATTTIYADTFVRVTRLA
jgi:lysophospholipase L1-like esterase